jgi:hypothetical protein
LGWFLVAMKVPCLVETTVDQLVAMWADQRGQMKAASTVASMVRELVDYLVEQWVNKTID